MQNGIVLAYTSEYCWYSISEVAINKAMGTIENVSQRLTSTVNQLDKSINTVEIDFGIKFDADFDVLVAGAGVEASLTVRLKWERK